MIALPLSEEGATQLAYELRAPGADRLLYVADAMRAGWTLERIHELTGIDPWFLAQIADLMHRGSAAAPRGREIARSPSGCVR